MKKLRIIIFTLIIFTVFCVPSFAQSVYDGAGLLTQGRIAKIEAKAQEIKEQYGFNVIVVTTNSLDGKSPKSYADDFYDYTASLYGTDGVLFLVSMEDRDWYISTSGYGRKAISNRRVDAIADECVPYLSSGDYGEAFSEFLELTDNYLYKTQNGVTNDTPVFVYIMIALIIAAVISIITVFIFKAQLTSVRYQRGAGRYQKPGSVNITNRRERFLYRNVIVTDRPKSNSGGGGGGFHGGGGGKF